MKPYTYFGAETYNCDAYGQHAYSECAVAGTGTGSGGSGSNGGGLSNTGDLIILPLALAGAVLIASAILIVKRLRRHPATQK